MNMCMRVCVARCANTHLVVVGFFVCFFFGFAGRWGGFSLSRSGAPCDGSLVSFLDKLIQREAAVLILTPFGPDLRAEKKYTQNNDVANLPIRRTEDDAVCQMGKTANAVHLACLP